MAVAITDTMSGIVQELKFYSLPGSSPTALKTELLVDDFGVQVFPNPSYGTLSISWENLGENRNQVAEVRMFSPNGQMLETISVSPTAKELVRDNQQYPAGVYLYQLLGRDGTVLQHKKVVMIR